MTRWTRRHALTAGVSLATAIPIRKPHGQEPQIGRLTLRDPPLPPIGLKWRDQNGTVCSLADYAGMGVVLNLWATWCTPCVLELPSLATLVPKLVHDGIAIVPISGDIGGAPAVRQYFVAHGIVGLGVWLDDRSQAVQAVGAVGLPTTLIIDHHGREVARLLGPADWSAPGTVETLRALCDL